MKKLSNIWAYCGRHKYLITIIIGVLIIGVVDENSLRKFAQNQLRINELNTEIKECAEQYEKDSLRLDALTNGNKGVERVARERYYMKRPNEDIFIISE